MTSPDEGFCDAPSKTNPRARGQTVRPPRSVQRMKQLCVSLEPDCMIEINIAARAEGVTRSEWVRTVIWDRLAGDEHDA